MNIASTYLGVVDQVGGTGGQFFDEFNSNDEIGEAVKAKHAYISPNFILILLSILLVQN